MYHSEPEREPMRSSLEMNEVHRNLRGMMHLLEKMVALKDPYTAGHQQNVAALSVAIGRKMGLAATQLESVEMAGKIHDIAEQHEQQQTEKQRAPCRFCLDTV